jgi:hypothetical protein
VFVYLTAAITLIIFGALLISGSLVGLIVSSYAALGVGFVWVGAGASLYMMKHLAPIIFQAELEAREARQHSPDN